MALLILLLAFFFLLVGASVTALALGYLAYRVYQFFYKRRALKAYGF